MRLALAAVFFGTTSCGNSPRPAGLDSPDFSIEPFVEAVFTVGALDGAPWETFGSVTSLAFDAEGTLFILDQGAGHVVAVDSSGGYVRTISRRGEGPGELARPEDLFLFSDGRIGVMDFMKFGLQLFNRDGTFLDAIRFTERDRRTSPRRIARPAAGRHASRRRAVRRHLLPAAPDSGLPAPSGSGHDAGWPGRHRRLRWIPDQAPLFTSGLYRYSRHPNYFCDMSMWVVFYFFGVAASGQWVHWTGLGFVLLIALFIPSMRLTERISAAKYPAYREYQATTPALIPGIRPGSTRAPRHSGATGNPP